MSQIMLQMETENLNSACLTMEIFSKDRSPYKQTSTTLVSEYVDWAFIQDTLSFSVPTPEATNQNTYKGISGSSDTMRSLGVAGGLTLVTSVVDPSIWSETTRWTKSFRGPQLIPAMTGHLWCDLLRRALHLWAFTPYGYNFQPTTVQ